MKILLVHNAYRNRGGEDSVVEAERALLRAAGHDVAEYFRSNETISAASLAQNIRLGAKTIWNRTSYREMRELVRHERPDVAHFHNTLPLISPAAHVACAEAGVPVVQSAHNYRTLCPAGNLFREGRPCEECVGKELAWPGVRHACYRGSRAATAAVAAMNALHRELGTWRECVNAFIAPSRFARQKLSEGGLPAEKIFVKPHFVTPDPGCRSGEGAGVIFVGRLSEEKGLRTLLKAWRQAGTAMPLRIVGDGPLRAELEVECERLELGNVRFEGKLERGEAIAAIRKARILIAPSECYETFSMTIAEAAACGVPAIASRHGALAEIVDERHTGLLFEPGIASDLAATIDWAGRHPGAIEEMGGAARRKFEEAFSAERNLPQLMEIYERAGAYASTAAVTRVSLHSCNDAFASVAMQGRSAELVSDEARRTRQAYTVLGVSVDTTQIPDVVGQMRAWIAEKQQSRMIAVTGMHGVMEAQHDANFQKILGDADAVVPDGMPLVWLGRLRGHTLRRRVYGPELMTTFCEQTASEGYRHFLYGGVAGQADRLAEVLMRRFPGMKIAGTYAPPFRSLTEEEDAGVTAMINDAAPDVVWVGLGTPKQERWMHEHRAKLRGAVLVGVGAAFDIHTGTKTQAPEWMREHGFEWFYRLVREPRRLWKRYLIYGSEFVVKAGWEMIRVGKKAHAK
jgi:exopolysaccharide biosynthesis WecB/TagA/CpsF family protein